MARKPGHSAPQHGRTVQLTPDEADRYRTVVELRRAGWTFQEIADQTGYADRASAKRAYDAALRRWGAAAVDDLRATEGERIDQLWRRLQHAIAALGEDADPRQLSGLVDSAVRVSKARRDLFGLDAPQHVEVGVSIVERQQVADSARAKAAAIEATLAGDVDDVDPPALAAAT